MRYDTTGDVREKNVGVERLELPQGSVFSGLVIGLFADTVERVVYSST